MSQGIDRIAVAEDRYAMWGVTINDYSMSGEKVDFEGLLVNVATNRAAIVEGEINPLQSTVRKRNIALKSLSDVLSDLYAMQADYGTEAAGSDYPKTQHISTDRRDYFVKYFGGYSDLFKGPDGSGYTMNKSNCERALQMVKSEIDKLNNDNQLDMTRLQSLVAKRDESFTTASSMMSSISDTRGNAIKAIS